MNYPFVSEFLGSNIKLNICNSTPTPIKVFQWQPKGDLDYNANRGVYSKTKILSDEAFDFIENAIVFNADLVITPEYSFPYETLNEILNNKALWPVQGSLWCLCMQGESTDQFIKKMEHWKKNRDVRVYDFGIQTILRRNFVDPLIYLFRDSDGALCVLPQLKTCASSDKWNEHEASDLSLGDTIYIFDLSGNAAECNIFVSFICSDALNINLDTIINRTSQNDTIIFHPQLNPEPRHIGFRRIRTELFTRNHRQNFRYLSLNWASGTMIGSEVFNKPWSAFYRKRDSDIYNNRDLRNENHDKGTYYALDRYTEIWYSPREEHCKLFEINKGFCEGASLVACTHLEPITKSYLTFDYVNLKWQSNSPKDSNISQMILNKGYKYDYPLSATISECDIFFGLCFGWLEEGELSTDDNELTARTVIGSDCDSDRERAKKIRKYMDLLKLIKRNRFPKALSYLEDNHELRIEPYYFNSKNNICGNLYPIDDPSGLSKPYSSAVLVITDDTEKNKVQELTDQLCKKCHPDFLDKVIVYYKPIDNDEYTYYDEHLDETRISVGNRSKKISSINVR